MNRSLPSRLLAWLIRGYHRRQAIAHLSKLNDHLLSDIGIARGEIDNAVDGLIARAYPASPKPAPKPAVQRRRFAPPPGAGRRVPS